jgi:DNA-binding transcriptional regulator of glucitol operon
LKEKVGYPWTTLPENMFTHAGQGYAGHGTLCGTLGVSSYVINLVVYDKDQSYKAIIDRMMWWYAGMKFPTERFDDISAVPKQIQAQAMTPLCHTSVSKWTLAAGKQVKSKEKNERCAKVAGEVVYTVTHYLNEYFEGRWKPAKWEPSKAIASCIECHGPEDNFPRYEDGMNHQQGHMECLLCHQDHTK